MRRGRTLASLAVVLFGLLAVSLGVTWASDDPPPHLERDGDGMLFRGVELEPGVPVTRCATLRPRKGTIESLDLDGTATGTLAPAVRLTVVRGVARSGDAGCASFVPEETVYSGPLDALPPQGEPVGRVTRIPADTTFAYRATIELAARSSGRTTFGLRLTGSFRGDAVPAGSTASVPGSTATDPAHCLQRQTTRRVVRTARRGARVLEVHTPAALPLTIVRPLPVYVRSSSSRRPVVVVGRRGLRPVRIAGGRWRAYVPLALLSKTPRLEVRSGDGLHVTVPVPARPCAARLRAFVQHGGTVDLRIDAPDAVRGARLSTDRSLGRPRALVVTAAGTTTHGRRWRRMGRPGGRGLPSVTTVGRAIEVTDVPPRTTTVAVRVVFAGRSKVTLRQNVCGRDSTVTAEISTHRRVRRTARLHLDGDRCAGRP